MRIYLRDVLRQTVLPEAGAPGPARLRAEKGYSLSEREYPFCFYRPQHCLFSALPRSAKNAGWQLARRWRGNRSYAAYQQAASVTVRSTAYTFFRCRRGRGRSVRFFSQRGTVSLFPGCLHSLPHSLQDHSPRRAASESYQAASVREP